jgi:hypothetical protein
VKSNNYPNFEFTTRSTTKSKEPNDVIPTITKIDSMKNGI